VRSALEWAQVRALVADEVSEREIARRLGINRRTVARLARSEEPPRYRRAPSGSQFDPFEPVVRRLLAEWPAIKAPRLSEILRDEYGYTGSLRLVQEHLQRLRPSSGRPAQRTGYRPGQVLQLDWGEMPTRPRLASRERRVYALVASLPYSGAQTAFFSLEMTLEAFLEGTCAPSSGWASSVEAQVRYLKSGFWPARRFSDLRELDERYADWRDRICNRRLHATGRFAVAERLAEERAALRPLAPTRFDWSGQRTTRVPIDGYLRHGSCFYRAPERLVHERVELRFDRGQVWILHRGREVARYPRSYEHGLWLPPPIMRPEPSVASLPAVLPRLTVAPPELADYAELCV
jgi:hypothetical protein